MSRQAGFKTFFKAQPSLFLRVLLGFGFIVSFCMSTARSFQNGKMISRKLVLLISLKNNDVSIFI